MHHCCCVVHDVDIVSLVYHFSVTRPSISQCSSNQAPNPSILTYYPFHILYPTHSKHDNPANDHASHKHQFSHTNCPMLEKSPILSCHFSIKTNIDTRDTGALVRTDAPLSYCFVTTQVATHQLQVQGKGLDLTWAGDNVSACHWWWWDWSVTPTPTLTQYIPHPDIWSTLQGAINDRHFIGQCWFLFAMCYSN